MPHQYPGALPPKGSLGLDGTVQFADMNVIVPKNYQQRKVSTLQE